MAGCRTGLFAAHNPNLKWTKRTASESSPLVFQPMRACPRKTSQAQLVRLLLPNLLAALHAFFRTSMLSADSRLAEMHEQCAKFIGGPVRGSTHQGRPTQNSRKLPGHIKAVHTTADS